MTVFMAPDDVDTLRDICGPPGDHPCYCEDVEALCDSHEAWRNAAAMSHGDLLDELEKLEDINAMTAEMLTNTLRTARNRLNEVYRLRDLCKEHGINHEQA